MSAEPTIELTDTPTEADQSSLRRSLLAENRAYLGEPDHRALGLLLRHAGHACGPTGRQMRT